MTARSGGALNTTEFAGGTLGGRKDNLVGGAVTKTEFASSASGGRKGRNTTNATVLGVPAAKYLNYGYYVAGSVWESWITSEAPSTTPPSGHTLSFIKNILIG